MEIPHFTALCILPDTEQYLAYSRKNSKGKPKRWMIPLEKVDELLLPFTTVTLKRAKGLGYVLVCGWFFIKTDLKKTKVLLKLCKIKMTQSGKAKPKQ